MRIIGSFVLLSGPPGVLGGPLPRFGGRRDAARASSAPTPGAARRGRDHADRRQPFEDRDHLRVTTVYSIGRPGCGAVDARGTAARRAVRASAQSSPAVAARRLRVVEHARGLGELARVHQRGAELGHEPRAPAAPGRVAVTLRARAGPIAAAQVTPTERRARRAFEPLRRPPRELVRLGAGVAKLDAVAVGLLEVVADECVERLGTLLEPVGVALVQAATASPSGSRRRSRRGAAGGGSGSRPRLRAQAGRAG